MVALSKTLLWLILGVYICTFVKCEPETPPDATVEPEPEGGFEDFFDEHNVHDDGHIKEHMDDIDLANHTLNKEEKEFHFFREHDTDMNQKIDGLEMLEALGHSMPFKVNIPVGHTQDQIAQMEQTAKDKWMAKLTGIIDKALKEHDTDGDGYLSYPEYVSSIRSNALKAPDAAAAAGQAAQPQQ